MMFAEKLAWLQMNAYSVSIEFNENRNYYRTLREFFDDDLDGQVEASVQAECIARDQLVVIQLYPLTPIGFVRFVRAGLADAVDDAYTWLQKHRAENGPYKWPVS